MAAQKTLTRWPWVSALAALAAAISPLGTDIVSGVFSSEAISRSISSFMLMTGLAGFGVLALVEWFVRSTIRRRRLRTASIPSGHEPR